MKVNHPQINSDFSLDNISVEIDLFTGNINEQTPKTKK
jgi:hypothetical protein